MRNKNLISILKKITNSDKKSLSINNDLELLNSKSALTIKGGTTCTGYSCGTNNQCNGKVSCLLSPVFIN
ncbi:MAG: hypothetical protein U0W65_11780 [Bacteroidia bacterium]